MTMLGFVALVAACLLAGIGIGVWRKCDIRINVLLLALVLTAVVAMGFSYAGGIDGVSQEMFAQLMATATSEEASADSRMSAIMQMLDSERAFVRDLIAVISIAGSAITLIGTAIGFLLRAGNDLSEPHAKAVEGLIARGEDAFRVASLMSRNVSPEEFERAMKAIERSAKHDD